MIAQLLNNHKTYRIIFLLLFALCIFLLLGRMYKSGSAIGGDAVYYYSNLRSIAIDRDLNFENEYKYFHNQISDFTGNRKIPVIPDKNPITQKLPAKYPIGSAIFLAPTFLLTHLILTFLQNIGTGITADGYNIIYQATAALTSLSYAFLGLLLIYRLGKIIFEPKIAFWTTLIIWLATPLIYYMTMEPLSSQPISFFCISLFIYLWYTTRKNRNINQWIIMGVIGGLMSIVRYQDALFLLLPIIDHLITSKRKQLISILLFILTTALIIVVQLTIDNYLNGSPLRSGYGDAGFPYLTSPKILYTLFSLKRGLFIWSPALIFASIGLCWLIKKTKIPGILLALLFLLQIYVVSSWTDPSQGDSFGNRILINSNTILALGLMQFLKSMFRYQKIILPIFILLIILNVILATLFTFRIIGQPY